eukprot:9356945-Alexandrium_andersonii.AAC.1
MAGPWARCLGLILAALQGGLACSPTPGLVSRPGRRDPPRCSASRRRPAGPPAVLRMRTGSGVVPSSTFAL